MRTKRTTLSFLTESKASHVSLSSIRRVAITLLVMLLTTASAWAQQYYQLSLNANYQGGAIGMADVPVSNPTYTLASYDEPIRTGYMFCGWSTSSTGAVQYRTNDKITLNGNLTLYAIWDDNPYMITLIPSYDGGVVKSILVPRNNPKYTLTSDDEPTRTEYTFYGWSESPRRTVDYRTGNKVTITDNMTLYAVWGGTINSMTYTITDEEKRQVELFEYEGDKPEGTLNIPSTVTISGKEFSVTSIGNSVFSDCSSLQSVTIPNSVTSIWDNAFRGCSNLMSITIPNSVKHIGNSVFRACTSLQSVTIPNSVTSIGEECFRNCTSLQSVTIPNSVTSIGEECFRNCTSLQSVIIPESVTNIEKYVFKACTGLQSVTIPNSVTRIGDAAFDACTSLLSITIPNSVSTIGGGAFSGCSNLKSVTIPNSVTTIGDDAFGNCSNLETVTIPNSVMNIGRESFWGCRSLQSVTINGNPKIGTDAFWGILANVTMNLTASQIGNDYWTTFYNDGYNFQADENTTVYKGTVNESSLVLTEVEDKIVNRGTAVILKSTGNPVMTLTDSESSDTNGNDLRGRSDRTLRTDVIANISDANAIYTMGNTSAGFGFHRYTGEYVPAGKAFIPLYIENEAKAQSLTIVFAIGSTGIKSVSSDSNVQNDWFSLDGTRLSGKPSQPGIYVNGKKKVVIK